MGMKWGDVKKSLEAIGDVEARIESVVRTQLAQRAVPYTMSGRRGSRGLDRVLLEKSGDSKIVDLQKASDDVYLLAQVLGVKPQETDLYKRKLEPLVKAMSVNTAVGTEWVPTRFSAELIDAVRLELKVADLFRWIDMPSNPYTLPVVAGDAVGYLQSESSADAATKLAASTPATGSDTFTAVKIAARVLVSTELEEDSIVPVLDFIRDNVVRALAGAKESAVINGDTDVNHMDSDVTSAADARKAWDGLRKLVPAACVVSLATFNIANIRAIRRTLGIYGTNPSDLAWICGPKVYQLLLAIDEVTTVDKYGPNATILKGELARLDGIPVIVSENLREDMNSVGVYDGTTTTMGVLLCVYRPGFLGGTRRTIVTKTKEDIETDQQILVSNQRLDFMNVWASGTTVVAEGQAAVV